MLVALLARAKDARDCIHKHPDNYTVGLCKLLCKPGDNSLSLLQGIMRAWPENTSGSFAYPVPAPEGYSPPTSQVYGINERIHAFDNLPKYTGEYGAARLRLLDFIIAELEKLT